MSVFLETAKLKRTGFFPAFLFGGLLAGAFPVVNMAARPEKFIYQQLPAPEVLAHANWQMIAMLNLFFVVIGACVMYHTEYSNRAIQKMEVLPQRAAIRFAAKAAVLFISLAFVLLLEAVSFAFCIYRWFPEEGNVWIQLIKMFGYALALSLPAVFFMLLIASVCHNMWISLGVGVIFLFIVTVLPQENDLVSFLPFALPFQTLVNDVDMSDILQRLFAVAGETVLLFAAQVFLWNIRRDTVWA